MKINWRELPKDNTHPRFAGIYTTLTPKGIFKLNRAAFERLGSPEAVKILYDPDNSRIGFQPTSAQLKNAYRVVRFGNHGGRIIRAHRLITQFGLDLPATVRFYDADIDRDGILLLDLRTARVPPSVTNHVKRNARKTPPPRREAAGLIATSTSSSPSTSATTKAPWPPGP
jgi:hypothetical protein